MECLIRRIDISLNDKSQEVYAHIYHTGDPDLDEKLGLHECSDDGYRRNIKLSERSEEHKEVLVICIYRRWNCTICIKSNCIVIETHRNIKLEFTTKEEFAVLKALLNNEVYRMILDKKTVEISHLYDNPDLMCNLKVENVRLGLLLCINYFNTKYGFEYTCKQIITEEWDYKAKSIVKFMGYIDRFLYSKNRVQEKLKNVQIYLIQNDREIPGYYPGGGRIHKMIIENTFIMIDVFGIDDRLNKYIMDNVKLPFLLPVGVKRC